MVERIQTTKESRWRWNTVRKLGISTENTKFLIFTRVEKIPEAQERRAMGSHGAKEPMSRIHESYEN